MDVRLAQVDSEYFHLHLYAWSSHFCMTYSARVFEGIWNKTWVAVKVLRTDSGVTPSSDMRLDAFFQWNCL